MPPTLEMAEGDRRKWAQLPSPQEEFGNAPQGRPQPQGPAPPSLSSDVALQCEEGPPSQAGRRAGTRGLLSPEATSRPPGQAASAC